MKDVSNRGEAEKEYRCHDQKDHRVVVFSVVNGSPGIGDVTGHHMTNPTIPARQGRIVWLIVTARRQKTIGIQTVSR